jgi:hypothetical protein
MIRRQFSHRRIRIAIALALLVGFLVQCQRAFQRRTPSSPSVVIQNPVRLTGNTAVAAPATDLPMPTETVEKRAARDPLGFIEYCLDHYDHTVRDYKCVFTKQEMLSDGLSAEQVMNAFFREKPFSVRLEWTKNEDKCSRVLYVADRWVDKGKQMAVVEPGAIARLFIPYVMKEIDGADAHKSSRRMINQFGLRNSMELIIKYCKLSREKGQGKFDYIGTGQVDGRDTLVFERHLPYAGEGGGWPDRVLVVHIDKETLTPALCNAYADDAKQNLLGKYMTTSLKINVNLPDSTFTKEDMGL